MPSLPAMAARHIMASWEEPPLPRSFDSVFYGAAGTSGEEITAGYTAWYRADDVTRSGNNVTQWNDRSGNGIHMLQYTAANTGVSPTVSPQFVSSDSNFNNQPSIDFTAQNGNNFVRFSTVAGPQNSGNGTASMYTNGGDQFSMFAVYRAVAGSSILGYDIVFGDSQGYLWLGPSSTTLFSVGNVSLTQSGWSRGTTFASHSFNGATSGSANLTLKTTGLSTVNSGSNNAFSSRGNAMSIGGAVTAGQRFRGHVAECIMYPTALTGNDASKTEDYLAARYNLTW